ncbi:MAG: hypothetical protein K2K25_02940 [Muribaculaceae bacterium]|nr:hypothetical protein [Muribaculaceae bacterium]
MGQNQVVRGFLYFVGLIFSFYIGFLVANLFSEKFNYSAQITLADISNILVTSLVTIFAAWYLSKKLNEDRYAKELAINDLKAIEENISSVVDKAHNPGGDIIGQLMPLINQLHHLLKRLERTCAINGKKVSTDRIMNSFLCFYGCATNFEDKPLNLDLIISYGDDLIVEIRGTIAAINKM